METLQSMNEAPNIPLWFVPEHVPQELVRDFNAYDFSVPDEEVQLTLYNLARKAGSPSVFWSPYNGGHWVVTRADSVEMVLTDAARFSNRYISAPKALNPVRLYRPLQIDPPDHAPYRKLLSIALSPRAVEALSKDARELTVSLIEGFRERGECEFVSEFAEHMPIGIFMAIVGLPESDRQTLLDFASQIARPKVPADRMQGYSDLDDYIAKLVEARRDAGADDFTSYLCSVEIEGKRLDEDELIGMLGLVMIAGLDTVVGVLGHITRYLARNPAKRHELRQNPDLIPNAVEEFLRRFAHVQLVREVREDLAIEGVQMKNGDMVLAPVILHNLDEDKFDNPMAIDFNRARRPTHLTFGGQVHRCLGAMLARTELQIFLQEWLTRIPDFEIKPGSKITTSTRVTWILNSLPLQWSVA